MNLRLKIPYTPYNTLNFKHVSNNIPAQNLIVKYIFQEENEDDEEISLTKDLEVKVTFLNFVLSF